jgi:hypothetical protein
MLAASVIFQKRKKVFSSQQFPCSIFPENLGCEYSLFFLLFLGLNLCDHFNQRGTQIDSYPFVPVTEYRTNNP